MESIHTSMSKTEPLRILAPKSSSAFALAESGTMPLSSIAMPSPSSPICEMVVSQASKPRKNTVLHLKFVEVSRSAARNCEIIDKRLSNARTTNKTAHDTKWRAKQLRISYLAENWAHVEMRRKRVCSSSSPSLPPPSPEMKVAKTA